VRVKLLADTNNSASATVVAGPHLRPSDANATISRIYCPALPERLPVSCVSLLVLSVDVDDSPSPDLAAHEAAGGGYDVFQTDLHRRPLEIRFGQQRS
jgi:hypothetical protein